MRGEFLSSHAPYGYRKSKDDKHILEIDERTAPTVIRMFEMAAYDGYGYNKIARVLSEQRIITPSAYQAEVSGRPFEKNPYEWNLTTVFKMMTNETYLGHTTFGKRKKISFKSKKVIKQNEDKWIVTENTHPPLISEQLWEDAHKRLGSRKREGKQGEPNIFAGLIKCDRCGYALTIANSKKRRNYFSCNTYRKKGKDACSGHYIPEDELYNAVFTEIMSRIKSVERDEKAFRQSILEKVGAKKTEMSCSAEEITAIEKRIRELEYKFDKLYDDRLEGILSDRKFKELSAKCEHEQECLSSRLEQLREQTNQQSSTETNVARFVEEIKKHCEIEALDKQLLNRLVDKIAVSESEVVDGKRRQEIHIFYKYIGDFSQKCTAR